MMRTRVKVCCIASPEEAAMATRAGADALGLVGAMPSGPGPIPDDAIAAIAALAPPAVEPFLLTSETEAAAIEAHAARTGVSTVQIVAPIAPETLRALRSSAPRLKRVVVVHVEDERALDTIADFADAASAFLLDSGRPSAATPELGGTGRTHDWAISAAFVRESPRPVFLAGGLNPANVRAAIAAARPYGVDLCSGIRTNGLLDGEKLKAFMAAVHGADWG